METSRDLLVHHATLVWELQQEEAIRRSFWIALLGSGVVIAWSLLGLALVPELTLSSPVADVFLGLAVAGALGCLILFGILLRVMVRSPAAENAGGSGKGH